MEQWCRVPGFSRYLVSNTGRVQNGLTGQMLKGAMLAGGRMKVTLYGGLGKKTFRISQVVAMAFLGHIPDRNRSIIVDHKDNDNTNNNLDNLQLITVRENSSKDAWRKNPRSLYPGVGWLNGKWRARIRVDGKLHHLGFFEDEETAYQAYINKLNTLNN